MSPRKAPEGLPSQWPAVEALVRGLRGQMYVSGAMELDVAPLLADFERATDPAFAEAMKPGVHRIAESFAKSRARQVSDLIVANGQQPQLWSLLKTALDHLTTYERDDELVAARSELAAAEQEHLDTVAAIEKAVANADIDEVLRLRVQSEVLIPKRIAEARAKVLELETEKAEVAAVLPAAMKQTGTSQAEAAQERVYRAERAVVTAREKHAEEVWWANMTAVLAESAEGEVMRQRTERDVQRAEAARSNEQRMRKLAGLPAGVAS